MYSISISLASSRPHRVAQTPTKTQTLLRCRKNSHLRCRENSHYDHRQLYNFIVQDM